MKAIAYFLLVFAVIFLSVENMPPMVQLRPSTNIDFGMVLNVTTLDSHAERCSESSCIDDNETNIAHQQSNVSLWQKRFGRHKDYYDSEHQQPRKYIFFKHIRKAGGTFFRAYMSEVRRYHSNAEDPNKKGKTQLSKDPRQVSYYEQEFAAMDWRCPEVDPRWNNTLSVTILREPISRQISEFFYSGFKGFIQSKNSTKRERKKAKQLLAMYTSGNYNHEFYTLVDHFLPKWMEQKHDQDWLFRHYTDEFQVRAFSGECISPEQCFKKKRFPCEYGEKFGGGLPTGGEIDEQRLRRAKVVLESFDLVLIMETMGAQAKMVADFMGVPLQNASLAREASGAIQNSRRNKNQTNLVDDIANNATNAYSLLQNASKYEARLYEYAVSLNQDTYNKWTKGKPIGTDHGDYGHSSAHGG